MSVALSNFCHGCGAGFGVGIDLLIAERVDVISPIGGWGELRLKMVIKKVYK